MIKKRNKTRKIKQPHFSPYCAWIQDEDGNWETDCGELHILIDGTPRENKMIFCCYCGKPID